MNHEPVDRLVHPESLGDTLDAVNSVLFERLSIGAAARSEVSAWVAERQGLPGSYAGMFAPTEYDYAFGALVFTGEPIRSSAGTGHVLSEEACRALLLLGDRTTEVQEALARARRAIFHRMEQSEPEGQWAGVYCCATCSVALWRHLSASVIACGDEADARRLENGLKVLNRSRDGKGRWKRFPFYYTLLALLDIPSAAAREELSYAALVVERALRRSAKLEADQVTGHARRRVALLERVLEAC